MLSLLVREVSAQILVVLVCHCCVVMLLVRIEANKLFLLSLLVKKIGTKQGVVVFMLRCCVVVVGRIKETKERVFS